MRSNKAMYLLFCLLTLTATGWSETLGNTGPLFDRRLHLGRRLLATHVTENDPKLSTNCRDVKFGASSRTLKVPSRVDRAHSVTTDKTLVLSAAPPEIPSSITKRLQESSYGSRNVANAILLKRETNLEDTFETRSDVTVAPLTPSTGKGDMRFAKPKERMLDAVALQGDRYKAVASSSVASVYIMAGMKNESSKNKTPCPIRTSSHISRSFTDTIGEEESSILTSENNGSGNAGRTIFQATDDRLTEPALSFKQLKMWDPSRSQASYLAVGRSLNQESESAPQPLARTPEDGKSPPDREDPASGDDSINNTGEPVGQSNNPTNRQDFADTVAG